MIFPDFPMAYPDLWLREFGIAFKVRADDAPFVVRPAFDGFERGHMRKILLVGAALLILGAASAAEYTVTDLGTLDGTSSDATGINNRGLVVGAADSVSEFGNRAVLFERGTLRDIGTLGGPNSEAWGINSLGQVVGWAYLPDESEWPGVERPFLYSHGRMIDLGTLGGSYGRANDINDRGQAVGVAATTDDGAERAFLYWNGQMLDLGALGGSYSTANAINEPGHVVGSAYTVDDAEMHGFLYAHGSMVDLGTLGGWASGASDINNRGQVIGWSYLADGTTYHAFLYEHGSMIDLHSLGANSVANGVNTQGTVVGFFTVGPSCDPSNRAFIYSSGVMTDLNSLIEPTAGWILSFAEDINDHGEIVGSGSVNGARHGFLLSPIDIGTQADEDQGFTD